MPRLRGLCWACGCCLPACLPAHPWWGLATPLPSPWQVVASVWQQSRAHSGTARPPPGSCCWQPKPHPLACCVVLATNQTCRRAAPQLQQKHCVPTSHWDLGEHAFTSQWAVGGAEGMEQVTWHAMLARTQNSIKKKPRKLAFVNGYFRYLRGS